MANEYDTLVVAPTIVPDLQVKVADGATKKLAAADANALNSQLFAAGTILPVHHIADISGSAGDTLARLKDAIIMDSTNSDNALRVTLTSGASIDVQTTAESSNTVKRTTKVTADFVTPSAFVPEAYSLLTKVLTIVISNRTDKPAYIKLHNTGDGTNANKPSADLASATDFDYVIDSYGTYEAEMPNCRLWHSIKATAGAAGTITVLFTSQE